MIKPCRSSLQKEEEVGEAEQEEGGLCKLVPATK